MNIHAPVANTTVEGGDNVRNANALFRILRPYKVHIFSGHTHYYENTLPAAGIYEHNIGAACGAWWAGHVNRCGAPNGYLVVTVKGDDVKWRYKATGRRPTTSSVYISLANLKLRNNMSLPIFGIGI